MPESKQRRAIRLAIERRGGEVTEMHWRPIGQMVEMSGREGGWEVFARMPRKDGAGTFEDHFLGYSWGDVLDYIALCYPLGEDEAGEGARRA